MSDKQDLIEIGSFRPEDAEGVADLFRSVYGDGYPIRLFYDPDALRKANADGEYLTLTARDSSGAPIGVQHLFRSAPYERIYEAGAGLIRKDYRQMGINIRMLEFLYNEWVPTRPDIEEVFGEPVCNHTHMQKVMERLRSGTAAIEVALMPAEAYSREGAATGRVAALLSFNLYKPKPHVVHIPKIYEEELRWIYRGLGYERTFVVSDGDATLVGETNCESRYFDFAAVSRIAVREIGADFRRVLTQEESGAREKGAKVIQVWLNAASPGIGSAAEILRGAGYFFGGALPRWFDTDGFLMQKLYCSPNWEGIQLFSDTAKKLLQIAKDDSGL
jgi:hypothetical protein